VSGKNLSLEMLRAGWVTTYEQVCLTPGYQVSVTIYHHSQAGAEYGILGKDGFLRIEAEAKYAPPFLLVI
jgi:hypothetical protein